MSLGSIITEALALHRDLRTKGMTWDEAKCALEKILREVWPKPKGRVEPWHYVCDLCDDTGARLFVCRKGQRCNGISTRTDSPKEKPGKYRRICAKHPDSEYEHDYIEPCVCRQGDRYRDKPTTPADFTDAGKTPPRKMTRFGQ